MSKEPVSHHYLPQFYLKSFAFEFSKKKKLYRVYSYDKEFQRVVIPKTTKEICCEKHRNTLDMLGEKDFFIEKSFSELESIMSEFFKVTTGYCKELEKINKRKLEVWDSDKFRETRYLRSLNKLMDEPYYFRLFNYFITVFYWRLTIHDEYFELNTTENYLPESINSLLQKSNQIEIIDFNSFPELLNEIKYDLYLPFAFGEQKNVMKVYKNLIFPMSGVYINQKEHFKLCQVYLPEQRIVSSDAPFITNDRGVSLEQEFIFTWSPNLAYINVNNQAKLKITNVIDWAFKLSVLNYLQAKRFVFSNDKLTLENVINYANMRYGNQGVSDLKKELLALVQ
ncbi:DUF4238 domain-containing protein [Vibrio alginolyticus]|uniref:DUF4238 domain-containing protein n=3 Tax=Vibrio alginolyticus TaxID=663 RepID=UPI00215EBCF6|nr:DUF4238 domain-containing protein [Vibrio alginolyticus]MCS0181782.1 DUF4238 domain-containing protein [Vibrio alginolyticus]